MAAMAIFAGFLLIFVANAITANDGIFTVLYAPDYVKFTQSESSLRTDDIVPVIAASFGLPFDRDIQWNGLEEVSLFKRPRANCLLSVTGLPHDLLDVKNVANYRTVDTENELNTEDLIERINNIHWKQEPLTLDFSTDEGLFSIRGPQPELFIHLPMTVDAVKEDLQSGTNKLDVMSLNLTRSADALWAAEIHMVNEVLRMLVTDKGLAESRNSPDFFHFHVNGLRRLIETYGLASQQVSDGVTMLKTLAQQVVDLMRLRYGDDYVAEIISVSGEARVPRIQSRHGRSLMDKEESKDNRDDNPLALAPEFSRYYSAIFNITLWSMIALGLTVFFVSWCIWNMDPGRDSIIYRMTSQRMKRD